MAVFEKKMKYIDEAVVEVKTQQRGSHSWLLSNSGENCCPYGRECLWAAMAKTSVLSVLVAVMGLVFASGVTCQQLSPSFYFRTCPRALPVIRREVFSAIAREPRMGASLLRLHFHDCFVNGCDGSVLLDDTPTMTGEKNSLANANSARGFEVIDSIKSAVDRACGGSVVSCADILAVAARDSVVAEDHHGGRNWEGETPPLPAKMRQTTTCRLPSPASPPSSPASRAKA
ncbi:hypothetical protein EJ110_NYTH41184 [Nymphaea thermarum]|nr:hypothetical protein EJ110_NYTH41184 [Nymphaea thermarum]